MRDIATDENIEAGKDYILSLIAQRVSEEKMDSNSDDDNDGIKYRMKISHLEQILEVGNSKELNFEKGKSPSQKQRWVIESQLGTDEYESFMKWLLLRMDVLIEDYQGKYISKYEEATSNKNIKE